ncbi:MAG: hypothetical protein C0514_07815 [Candidatus Puniceispirillum sp.]|nr:hypothetical protein [Candidatus Puniceispirillum sp.]
MAHIFTILLVSLAVPAFSSSLPPYQSAQLSEENRAFNDQAINEKKVIDRYAQQQMANPGAKPEAAFHALPEHMKAGAQQAVAYMRSQGYQGPQGQ